ncbi:MAG: glycosyltransferase family 4 protein [Planctomycetes bacterium]|nr:glycosyltransferase family 4 protein [Planctomycetota bacterium]
MRTLRTTWAIITGEYPPQPGGVSDYTRLVARELAEAGDDVHVWAPSRSASDACDKGVTLHRLEHGFGLRGLRQLGQEIRRLVEPRKVLVQYVPHGFGFKAMNILCPIWLNSLRGEHIQVMFHEAVFPFVPGQPLRHRVLAVVTRLTAMVAARGAREVFVSIPAWSRFLRPLGRSHPSPVWLPVPSTLPLTVPAEAVASARGRIAANGKTTILGHFGTYDAHHRESLASVLPGLLSRNGNCIALLLGRGSEQFAGELTGSFPTLDGRVHAPGELPREELAAYLAACDLLVQPYPDGVSSRRTTVMAGLALGLPIVTTEGFLTEPIWRRTKAVELAPATSADKLAASAEALLADPPRRVELGARAKSVYATTFAVERTIERLRSHHPQPC